MLRNFLKKNSETCSVLNSSLSVKKDTIFFIWLLFATISV